MEPSNEEHSHNAIAAIEAVCNASGAISKTQMSQIDRIVEISKQVLVTAADELVEEAGGAPLLSSKQADGTPLTVRKQHRVTLPS